MDPMQQMPPTPKAAMPKEANKYDHVIAMLDDEIGAALSYIKMLKNAREMQPHDEFMIKGLYGMVKDEYSHVRFIKVWLNKHNIAIPATTIEKINELESEMVSTFQGY